MKLTRTARGTLAALAGLAIFLATGASSCGGGGSGGGNAVTNQQQARDDTQYAFVQPLPFFPFSQIRQTVIEAEAIDALGIASTTFFFVPGITHPVYWCPSIGVPVPATDQISNPAIAQWSYNTDSVAGVTVGQQEPDGVFTGDTTGTNSLCVNGGGGQYLGYDEAFTISFTATGYWDTKPGDGLPAGHIHINGAPVMPVCKVKILNAAKHKAEEVCVKP